MHFGLFLASGEEIDGTRRGAPASFVFGDGNLPATFEQRLVGLRKGDDEQFAMPCSEAFGTPNPENVRRMRKRDFGSAGVEEFEPGLVVSFQAVDGELPGVIRSVCGDCVEVDFNHPLAGKDLVFDVTILDVEGV